jgi:hypothetical protein
MLLPNGALNRMAWIRHLKEIKELGMKARTGGCGTMSPPSWLISRTCSVPVEAGLEQESTR